MSESVKLPGTSTSVAHGAAIPFEVAVGGSPMPGLVVGVGVYDAFLQARAGGFLHAVGPFFDLYPNPSRGLHVEAAMTYSSATINQVTLDTPGLGAPTDYSGQGFGLEAGIGYELWIGPELSLGALARLQYFSAIIRAEDAAYPDAYLSLALPALLLTVTYH